MAEGVGFEPTEACTSTVFKTVAIDRSATPPGVTLAARYFRSFGDIGLIQSDCPLVPNDQR